MQFNLIFHQGEAPLFLLFCPPSAFGKFLLNVESRYSSLINKQGLTPITSKYDSLYRLLVLAKATVQNAWFFLQRIKCKNLSEPNDISTR